MSCSDITMATRLSRSAVHVLHALAHGARYGFDIIDRTGLSSATVYPTLGKLEDAGLIASTWENAAVAVNLSSCAGISARNNAALV